MGYKIGDRIRIVSEKPEYCAAGWSRNMNRYLDKEATITSSHSSGPYWRIDIDHGEWWWSADCFVVKPPELPDLDPISPEALSELYR